MSDLTDRLEEIAEGYEAIVKKRNAIINERTADVFRWGRFALFCILALGGTLLCVAALVAAVLG